MDGLLGGGGKGYVGPPLKLLGGGGGGGGWPHLFLRLWLLIFLKLNAVDISAVACPAVTVFH